jgi:glycosyltransferase involved in cell wall biosynthesis
MISLERLLGDEIYYYDDVESFILQARRILSNPSLPEVHRTVAQRYDWRNIAQEYEKVLQRAAESGASK